MTTESTAATPVERHEEFHVTVDGVNPIAWFDFCTNQGVKPLYIELNTMGLQLMCGLEDEKAMDVFTELFGSEFPEGKIVRVKHEVNVMNDSERPVYYECHVKIDGPMLINQPMASRDLYRANRWYLTRRSPNPFSAEDFFRSVQKRMENRANQKVVEFEYEVCVSDSNPGLDAGWAR